MLKKIKNLFSDNKCIRILKQAQINDSQSFVVFSEVIKLRLHFEIPEQRKILFEQISMGIESSKWIVRLKYLIIIHFLLIKTQNENLYEYIENIKIKQDKQNMQIEQLNNWLNTNILDYYHNYIVKLNCHLQFYHECKKIKPIKNQQSLDITLIVNCFKIINIINYILDSRKYFNKIAEFYPKLKIFSDVYSLYLKDLKIFYQYLKIVHQSIFHYYTKLSIEVLKHAIIFIHEMLNINDLIFQFFHNRYYYDYTKLIIFPKFIMLDQKKYQKFLRYVRKVDKTLSFSQENKKNYNLNQTDLYDVRTYLSQYNINNHTMIENIKQQKTLDEKFPDLHSYL